MGFKRTKDLDCFEEGRKKMGVDQTKDLELYEEKFWGKLKIWIVMKKKERFDKHDKQKEKCFRHDSESLT